MYKLPKDHENKSTHFHNGHETAYRAYDTFSLSPEIMQSEIAQLEMEILDVNAPVNKKEKYQGAIAFY